MLKVFRKKKKVMQNFFSLFYSILKDSESLHNILKRFRSFWNIRIGLRSFWNTQKYFSIFGNILKNILKYYFKVLKGYGTFEIRLGTFLKDSESVRETERTAAPQWYITSRHYFFIPILYIIRYCTHFRLKWTYPQARDIKLYL